MRISFELFGSIVDTMKCQICGGSDFFIDAGAYYCNECGEANKQTEEQTGNDEVLINRNLVSSQKATKEQVKHKPKLYSSWLTPEAYNIILYKQVSALIKLGASAKLKDVVLYMWSRFLQKCETAFWNSDSTSKKLSRLDVYPTKRDFKLLHGDKIATKKKKYYKGKRIRKKLAEVKKNAGSEPESCDDVASLSSELTSGNDVSDVSSYNYSSNSQKARHIYSSPARKFHRRFGSLKSAALHVRENCVHHMTLSKTLCFCYLGLLYTGDQLLLSDLLRFVKEDRIPFRKAFTCLPPSMKLQNADKAYFRKNTVPDMHKISLWCAKLIEFLNLPRFKHRPLLPVISRFIKDLNLPDDLVSVVKVLVYKTEKQESEWYEVKKRTKSSYIPIPLYEVKAITFIIVALKMLFVLDGEFEIEHCEVMKKINILQKDVKIFTWSDWKLHTQLKEYLFMPSELFPNFRHIDTLSVERILANYPIEPSCFLDDNKTVCQLISGSGFKDVLSDIVNIQQRSIYEPTSFPLKSQVKNFMEEWRTFHAFSETKEIDFSVLKEDFSSHLILPKPSRDYAEENELLHLLLSTLYKSVEIFVLHHSSPTTNNIIRTSSKYWIKKFTHRSLASSKSEWLDKLPSSFKWLLIFLSKYIQVNIVQLYREIMHIEKKLYMK